MNPVNPVLLTVILSVGAVVLLFLATGRRRRIVTQFDLEAEERHERFRLERLEWNRKVKRAKRHLRDAIDWRDPSGKAEFVRELFGDAFPQYLWYELHDLSEEEVRDIGNFFWGGPPAFGDFELHGRMLRIRNAKKFASELLGGVLPLEQIGHAQSWETIDEDGFPVGVVLFSLEDFYNETPTVLFV